MKIGLAQLKCVPGDVAGNGWAIVRQVRAAADRGCDVVALPEMSDTGYHMPTIVKVAAGWDGGVYAEVAGVAAERKITVVVGLSERVGDDIYNTVAVIGTDGQLVAKYRKTHLITAEPVCEQNYIRPGDALTLCTVGEFRVGLMTCYDIRFPELARRLSLAGAELLIVPAAFPLVRIRHWETILACRAIENQVYVAAVNRVGDDHGLTFGGMSCLLDPYGTILSSAAETEEALLVGEVSRDRLTEVRDRMKVYQDRREELYR
ncbi:carbon-nitrogen hydrolase family protein [Limnoglobus roseus]|uniref:Carbon-nitrogen hydrolase family protein n=1 Tax=Limnoglobus roseus TaxID=2598579 RepID=A0A5C1A463_9BACT|nr:nitrilase-related carbon-nitrogen hydrolase [Limnoglobus roseus]QEL13420.1 carbon-nitrogen hydrolase family protein [Limnoglobus roseus]